MKITSKKQKQVSKINPELYTTWSKLESGNNVDKLPFDLDETVNFDKKEIDDFIKLASKIK